MYRVSFWRFFLGWENLLVLQWIVVSDQYVASRALLQTKQVAFWPPHSIFRISNQVTAIAHGVDLRSHLVTWMNACKNTCTYVWKHECMKFQMYALEPLDSSNRSLIAMVFARALRLLVWHCSKYKPRRVATFARLMADYFWLMLNR
jgi:hypothetical protein